MNIIDMQMNIFHPQNYKNYLHFYFSIKWTIKNYYISYFLKKKIKLEIQILFFSSSYYYFLFISLYFE